MFRLNCSHMPFYTHTQALASRGWEPCCKHHCLWPLPDSHEGTAWAIPAALCLRRWRWRRDGDGDAQDLTTWERCWLFYCFPSLSVLTLLWGTGSFNLSPPGTFVCLVSDLLPCLGLFVLLGPYSYFVSGLSIPIPFRYMWLMHIATTYWVSAVFEAPTHHHWLWCSGWYHFSSAIKSLWRMMNSSAKLWGNCPMLGEMHMKNNLFSFYISDFKTKCVGQEPSGSALVSFLCSWHSFLLVSLPVASPPSSSPSTVRAFFLKFLSDPVYSLSKFFYRILLPLQ